MAEPYFKQMQKLVYRNLVKVIIEITKRKVQMTQKFKFRIFFFNIKGASESGYRVGQWLDVNCTSPMSDPPALLKW